MHVDKAGGDDATWVVFNWQIGVTCNKLLKAANGLHGLSALGAGASDQQAVLLKNRFLAFEVKKTGSVSFHA